MTHGPIVIGHRGASGYRPEHTLASYRLAIEMGADYIEPDLVSTRDNVLVARHEPEISATTDVAAHPEFADRRTTKSLDGVDVTGWFTEDFTLAELKTLRAVERIPAIRPRNAAFDGLDEIPTLQEVIDLARREGVGIYPETKHPTYFRAQGVPLEEKLVEALHSNGYAQPGAPVFIQSFEPANLRMLRSMTALRLVQLLDDPPRSPCDLAGIASYADGIGPNKSLLTAGALSVDDAHSAGLVVHPWTFRGENNFLPAELRQGDPASPDYLQATGNFVAELIQFFDLGVDGLFTDHPDVAVAARTEWRDG